MTGPRIAAAITALITALLLQATVVGPWAMSVPVSLPAVLVACVALVDGPGTGIAFGFATGLVADLGSTHPAGVLALCWLGVGLVAGLGAGEHPLRRDAAVAAGLACLGSTAAALLLAAVHSGGSTVASAFATAVPALVGDALLALLLVAPVRAFLRSDRLRPPEPLARLDVAGRRG